jgi:SAM-dependent methyltransferase
MPEAAHPLPLPPPALARRVGGTEGEAFLAQGRRSKQTILDALPADWRFAGRRVLDFGCGVGRVLRHFAAETAEAELHGCDIDLQSIAWLRESFPPAFRTTTCERWPPLEYADDTFDLIYVISIFTHLTEEWEAWLHELRRVLKPNGIALVTFHNRVAYEHMTGAPFDEAGTGMRVLHPNQGWERGGPMVYHSNWWIREHWGAILDVEWIAREGLAAWQSIACLRKRPPTPGCRLVQPFPYQPASSDFRGDVGVPDPQPSRLAERDGLACALDAEGRASVYGWFASAHGPVTLVDVRIAGDVITRLEPPFAARPDVARDLPDWPGALESGFSVAVPLARYGPGTHELTVIATDTVGRRHCVQVPLRAAEG